MWIVKVMFMESCQFELFKDNNELKILQFEKLLFSETGTAYGKAIGFSLLMLTDCEI